MTIIAENSTLGPLAPPHESAMSALRDEEIVSRIWQRDHTVWGPEPTEIANRLGWLDSPAVMQDHLADIDRIVSSVREAGYTHALLLGMGGSSLAPEVFREVFGVQPGFLDLAVVDTTDPAAIRAHADRLDCARTLFIPATKSGGTVETVSLLKYFYNRTRDALGADRAGEHFVAITDPGSGLADMAAALGFRHTFLNDPDIGGRYSALSCFGLVPAHLIGVDTALLLERARAVADECRDPGAANSGAYLGAALGSAAGAGRDKLTLLADPSLAPLGAWIEQLIAESTGKEGKGILPIDGEPAGAADDYGDDRIFAYLRDHGDGSLDRTAAQLARGGQPVVRLDLGDAYDVGGEFFRWEMATVIAGHMMAINPFDQPNVEAAKVLGRAVTEAYIEQGALPPQSPAWSDGDLSGYGDVVGESLAAILRSLLTGAPAPAYLAIQAYLPPGPETDDALGAIRAAARVGAGLPTTAGYGPRFLHSTGQLHKGDAGRGCFLQLTCDDAVDAAIPDAAGEPASSISFSVLKAAQASGDLQALAAGGRRVVRIHLGPDVAAGLQRVLEALTSQGPAS